MGLAEVLVLYFHFKGQFFVESFQKKKKKARDIIQALKRRAMQQG